MTQQGQLELDQPYYEAKAMLLPLAFIQVAWGWGKKFKL